MAKIFFVGEEPFERPYAFTFFVSFEPEIRIIEQTEEKWCRYDSNLSP